MKSLLARFLILTLPITLIGTAVADSNTERFTSLANYEIQNRAFALDYTKRSSEHWGNKDVKRFWAAYYELELINQKKYQNFAEKHNLDMEATTMTDIKTSSIRGLSRVAPEWTLEFITKATEKYIGDLEEMRRLGPAEDKRFLSYVVEQEYVQIQALKLASTGQPREGTQVLSSYIASLKY